MDGLYDFGVEVGLSGLFAVAMIIGYLLLQLLHPASERIYFPKPSRPGSSAFKWMTESELIEHAGLDSTVILRLYLLGLKLFGVLTILACAILAPVNWMANPLESNMDFTSSSIAKFSIANVPQGSKWLWAYIAMLCVCVVLGNYMAYEAYKTTATMRSDFLQSQERSADQFTVLVSNIPLHSVSGTTTDEKVDYFFRSNYRVEYLTHQVVYNVKKLANMVEKRKGLQKKLVSYENPGFWDRLWSRLWRTHGDATAIQECKDNIKKLKKQEKKERNRVKKIPAAMAFVSFRSRMTSIVCLETKQVNNPAMWLIERAPEPRDVIWENLVISYKELIVRRLLVGAGFIVIAFFSVELIRFFQSVANIEGRGEMKVVNYFLQDVLPNLLLKLVFFILQKILSAVTKAEGFSALSSLERSCAVKFYLIMFVSIIPGGIVTRAALEQLYNFITQSPVEIPKIVGDTILQNATFFVTFFLVDSWASIGEEILRLGPLFMFHMKRAFFRDEEQAVTAGCLDFSSSEPKFQLLFIIGLVYLFVSPLLLPLIFASCAFSYMAFRHQFIHVYTQRYESGAAFWPDVHRRLVVSLVVFQFLVISVLRMKDAPMSTSLIFLPVFTICFNKFCDWRFKSAFTRFSVQDTNEKDTNQGMSDNFREYLRSAYLQPIMQSND